jgi:hypothetical protein
LYSLLRLRAVTPQPPESRRENSSGRWGLTLSAILALLREQCRTFLQLLQQATRKAHFEDMDGAGWQEVRDLLAEITHTRGLQTLRSFRGAFSSWIIESTAWKRSRSLLLQDTALSKIVLKVRKLDLTLILSSLWILPHCKNCFSTRN